MFYLARKNGLFRFVPDLRGRLPRDLRRGWWLSGLVGTFCEVNVLFLC